MGQPSMSAPLICFASHFLFSGMTGEASVWSRATLENVVLWFPIEPCMIFTKFKSTKGPLEALWMDWTRQDDFGVGAGRWFWFCLLVHFKISFDFTDLLHWTFGEASKLGNRAVKWSLIKKSNIYQKKLVESHLHLFFYFY